LRRKPAGYTHDPSIRITTIVLVAGVVGDFLRNVKQSIIDPP
jgi:hypothetical protein